MKDIVKNAEIIDKELNKLSAIINHRIENFLEEKESTFEEKNKTALKESFYREFIEKWELNEEEQVVLLTALAIEIKPALLGIFHNIVDGHGRMFTQFGGLTLSGFEGFIPTIKTALFILAGDNITDQLKHQHLFDKKSKLYRKNILKEIKTEDGMPAQQRQLALTDSALSFILKGEDVNYEYSRDFPASQLTTELTWDDLVLSEKTKEYLEEINLWLRQRKILQADRDMRKHFKPGFRALFEGPSGTGKTLTATLIGQRANKPVYRINLSQLVSKYIGETEKNLEKIFNLAEKKDWILFFDEADSLFGQRSKIKTSNDRYANQETAYLLQKIESCDNLIILATNLRANFDSAFSRRFQAEIKFLQPTELEREELWKSILPEKIKYHGSVNIKTIAKHFNLSGGAISNVIRYCTMLALDAGDSIITEDYIYQGIKKNLEKQGAPIDQTERRIEKIKEQELEPVQ